jgi:hypothetical protein
MNGRMHRRALLESAFQAAVAACKRPEAIIDALPERPMGRVVVIAAGKGAVPMAQAVEAHWPDVTGLAVTRTGYGGPLKSIELIEARHPVPDEAGARAAERCLALADSLGEGDLLLVLLSGGASALLAAAPPPLTLDAKQALTSALLKSGASIGEINCVRRHLSRIKGGRLSGADRHPCCLRRCWRCAAGHRLGSERRGCDDHCRRSGRAGALRYRRSRWMERVREARRSGAGAQQLPGGRPSGRRARCRGALPRGSGL